MRRTTLTVPARIDILEALRRSQETFGVIGRRRYDALIRRAIRDVASDPTRPGSRDRSDLVPGFRMYHLLNSRERARTADVMVRSPRHVLLYHCPDEHSIEILRLLHDAMDPDRHLP